jgi:uncharacterized protein YjbI with pentapeptide repeats
MAMSDLSNASAKEADFSEACLESATMVECELTQAIEKHSMLAIEKHSML